MGEYDATYLQFAYLLEIEPPQIAWLTKWLAARWTTVPRQPSILASIALAPPVETA